MPKKLTARDTKRKRDKKKKQHHAKQRVKKKKKFIKKNSDLSMAEMKKLNILDENVSESEEEIEDVTFQVSYLKLDLEQIFFFF